MWDYIFDSYLAGSFILLFGVYNLRDVIKNPYDINRLSVADMKGYAAAICFILVGLIIIVNKLF